jgi:hypothetical protein
MRTNEVALGSDPEIFLESGDGTLLPAFAFLPSKYEPLKTPEEGQNYYWDGFQAEFNIVPSTEINECLKSVRFGLKSLLKAGQAIDPTARLSTKTVVETPLDMLRTLPPEFVEFGCMPSYNAYGISGISLDGINCPHRFAGGHIHFGISKSDAAMDAIPQIVRALDAILGVTCVSLFENFDNPIRRQYYGLAGEHRLPPHGLEYRPLSDAWLFNPKVASMVLEFARKILVWTVNRKNTWTATEDEVVECMLRSDAGLARKILKRNAGLLPAIGLKTSIDLMAPVEKSVDMTDIAENWNI